MRHRGFTLIELLVSFAIIALLIGLVATALQYSRNHSHQVQCISNLREMMRGASAYAFDNKQYMPFSNSHSLESGAPPKWAGAGWLYNWNLKEARTGGSGATNNYTSDSGATVYQGHARYSDIEDGLLYDYVDRKKSIYRCPADSVTATTGETDVLTSYMMNSAVTGLNKKLAPPAKLTQFRSDAIAFWEARGNDEGPDSIMGYTPDWNDGNVEPRNGRSSRHTKGLSVADFDGRAEVWANEIFDKEAAPPDGARPANWTTFLPAAPVAYSRLWCDPRYEAQGLGYSP